MFWKFNILTSSHIDTLLDKEDVTLRELMDEDDILQECKAQNRKLIDFLTQPQQMEEMVQLITTEPSEDVDEKLRFKYPNTACELLTSDVSQINDKLASEDELVNKLYSFLEGDKPLNPLLASFFSKVMGLLITRKSEMIFEYLKLKNNFVGNLLHHIGTSAVMDLLLRLITCIESTDIRRAVIEWLNEEKIVEKLVDSIVVLKDEEIHCNAAQSLCDIVRLGREQFNQQQDSSDPDPLLVTMEQEETVAQLLSNMFDSENDESVLINGLCVIHTLLEVRKGSEVSESVGNGENDRITQGINNVIAAIIPRLKDFHDLLVNPPKQFYSTMPSSVGSLDPPLGNTRLQVAKLITALVGANMHQVNTELTSLGTISTLMDLYFRYVWNNFLHTQTEQCLLIILNNGPITIDGKQEHPLLSQLFTDYKFVERLLDEWESNDTAQAAPRGKRKGFMGHLTKMANSVVSLIEKEESSNLIKDHFNELSEETRERWHAFSLGNLTEVNKKNAIELMRSHPLVSSSEDDDADFKDIPFPQDTAMQQAFSDYQLQQMTSNFIDQFGFNDEEFAEQDEKIDAAFSERISSIDADIQVDDAKQQSSGALFEQICNEKIQQFDNDDSDEDIWEEKPITFDKNAQQCRSERLQGEAARCNSSDEDSTDSGDELYSPVRFRITQSTEGMDNGDDQLYSNIPAKAQSSEGMEIDNSENPWHTLTPDSSSQVEPVAMDTTTPWENKGRAPGNNWADFSNAPTPSVREDNWADFSSFEDGSVNNVEGPRSSSPVAMDTTEHSNRSSAYIVFGDTSEASKEGEATPAAANVSAAGVDIHVTDLETEVDTDQQPDSTSSNPTPDTHSAAENANRSSQSGPPLPDSSLPPLPGSSPPHNGSSVDALVTSSSECLSSGSAVDAVIISATSSEVSEDSNSNPIFIGNITSTASVSSGSTTVSDTPSNPQSPSNSGSGNDRMNSVKRMSEPLDDLGANFNFLASSGLMRKSPTVNAASPSPSSVHGNGPVESPSSPAAGATAPTLHPMTDGDAVSSEPNTDAATTTSTETSSELTPAQKLELARSQAKEAQELYDAATVMGNGPV